MTHFYGTSLNLTKRTLDILYVLGIVNSHYYQLHTGSLCSFHVTSSIGRSIDNTSHGCTSLVSCAIGGLSDAAPDFEINKCPLNQSHVASIGTCVTSNFVVASSNDVLGNNKDNASEEQQIIVSHCRIVIMTLLLSAAAGICR